jgi:hypothetical protein
MSQPHLGCSIPNHPPHIPEQTLEHLRSQTAAVREAIRELDLGEESYKVFWSRIVSLEKLFLQALGSHEEGVLRAWVSSLGDSDIASLGQLLGEAGDTLYGALSSGSSKEVLSKLDGLGVLVIHSPQVYVETDIQAAPLLGSGAGWTEGEYQPRLMQLITQLQDLGIFKEDIVVRAGALRENMMRKEPYVIVEIPGIDKEVVVCDQSREITFVAQRIFGPNFYEGRSKAALRTTDGIFAVTYHRKEQWLEEISRLLFPADTSEKKRLDVRGNEGLRDAIKAAQSMSPEVWCRMSQTQKRAYRVPGTNMGLTALAGRFGLSGLTGNPIGNHVYHLELGAKIFGEGTVISDKLFFERATPEQLAAKVREEMTAKQWSEMTQKQKLAYRVPGSDMGLTKLARRVGITGSPISNHDVHLQLGEKIFGDGTAISEELFVQRATPDQLAAKIREKMTAAEWCLMTSKAKSAFRVPGTDMGLTRLATRFDVGGEPIGHHEVHLQLGERIFGEGTVISEELIIERATPEQLGVRIREKLTAQHWSEMTEAQRKSYQVPGTEIRLRALATLFGVKGDPVTTKAFHLQLGQKIFGEGTVISEKLFVEYATAEQLAAKVREEATAENWRGMKVSQKKAYRVPGTNLGLRALATRMGIPGSPITNHKDHLRLGEKIFGEGTVISEKLFFESVTPEQLAAKVKEEMTAKQWSEMTQKQKGAYRVPGSDMGLKRLATRMGIGGSPIDNQGVHLQLGEKIFREGIAISERLFLERATPKQLAVKIKEKMTAQHWSEMTSKQKASYRVPGADMGLKALATRFGIEGDPIGYHKVHLQLGKKIFGEFTVISEKLFKECATPDQLAAKIIEKMTAQQWSEMRQKQKAAYRVPGTDMGLRALATRLGIEGDPVAYHEVHLQLRKKIFGDT